MKKSKIKKIFNVNEVLYCLRLYYIGIIAASMFLEGLAYSYLGNWLVFVPAKILSTVFYFYLVICVFWDSRKIYREEQEGW